MKRTKVITRDGWYHLVLPRNEDKKHYVGTWHRAKHPESWGNHWAQAALYVDTIPEGDVYGIATFSSVPRGDFRDIFEKVR